MRLLVALRRKAYQAGVFSDWHAPVPVIVVGNITVGGTGKTPLVLWLVDFLKAHGYHPGIISRGYGGQSAGILKVCADSDPRQVGDEPALLARRAGCPLFVGRYRPAAAQALLKAHPECDVLVSDDGLQHYALGRDVEIAVVDGERLYGNGALIPVGPLREPVSRLASVDAVVVNSGSADVKAGWSEMTLRGARFYPLGTAEAGPVTAEAFAGQQVHAIAGIGHPARFFNQLRALGLTVIEHAFPDHYRFTAEDLQITGADAILMTEKDAVKCLGFAPENTWVLPVQAEIRGNLGEVLLNKLKKVN